MAGSAAPGVLYGEVSAGWTPDAPVALVLFHGYGANEQDLAPLGPMLAPALPCAALRAPLGVAPGGYAWFPPIALGDRDPARATGAAWQRIDAHMARDATVAAVGFSQGGLMATQLLRTRPERVAATVVLSGFVQAAPQPADERLAARRPAVFWGRGARDPMIPADAIEGTTSVADRPLHPHRARLPRSRARHRQSGNRRRPCLPQRPDRRRRNPLTARARPLVRAARGLHAGSPAA
jgi:phospholipase/carboxylesterase